MPSLPDVDIDVKDRDNIVGLFSHATMASQLDDTPRLIKHKTGVHFQAIPTDPDTGFSVFPYDVAEELGYYKVDFLPNHVYDQIESMEQRDELLNAPVDWSWFLDREFVRTLFHLGGTVGSGKTMADVVADYQPDSIDDIAHLIAIKLPAKKHLIGESWDKIRQEMWDKNPDGKPQFKRSHAYAYALVVILDAQLKIRRQRTMRQSMP